jgi:hypothetical protein
MTHDHDYFSRRAAEARAAASSDHGEMADVAGDLALAYAALARRHAGAAAGPVDPPAIPLDES